MSWKLDERLVFGHQAQARPRAEEVAKQVEQLLIPVKLEQVRGGG